MRIPFAGEKVRHALRLDRALRLVWQAGPGWTISSLALVFLKGLLPLLTLYLMKLIVDGVIFAMGAADKAAAFRDVMLLIIFAGVVAIVNALLQLIGGFIKEAQSLTVTDHMYDILHAKSIEVDLEYYENPQYLDTLHRAQQEGPYRPTHILDGLMQVGQSGLSLVAMAGLLISFHWGVAVVLFAAAIPGVLVRLKYSKRLFRWQRKRTPAERRAGYYNWLLTGYNHAKEMRLFDLGGLFMGRFRDLRQQLRRERLELVKRRSAADFVAQASAALAVFGSFGFIAYRTVGGVITLGDMVMYFQAFQRGLGFLRQVLSGMAGLYEDNLFLANLYEFLDLKPKVKEPDHPRPVPRPLQKGIGWFEDGEELSIGEWQKVALARAFLRESQIIVLDEPTSAMDAKSEYEVFRRIRQLLEGRTAILISHRFSTVRMADRIFAFEKGSISESGTHEQLIKSGGKYANLFEKQAQHYQ